MRDPVTENSNDITEQPTGKRRRCWPVVVLLLLALVIAAPLALLAWLDTTAGHRYLGKLATGQAADAGYELSLGTIEGSLWSALTIDNLVLRDDGVELLGFDRFEFSWSPGALLGRSLVINRLAVENPRVTLPESEASSEPSPPIGEQIDAVRDLVEGLQLPVDVTVSKLAINHLAITAPEQAAVVVNINGNISLPRSFDAQKNVLLTLEQEDGAVSGRVKLAVDPRVGSLDLAAGFDDPAGALSALFAGDPMPVAMTLDGAGNLNAWEGQLALTMPDLVQATVPLSIQRLGEVITLTMQPAVTVLDWPDEQLARLVDGPITGTVIASFGAETPTLLLENMSAGPAILSGRAEIDDSDLLQSVVALNLVLAGTADAYGYADDIGWGSGRVDLAYAGLDQQTTLTLALDAVTGPDIKAGSLTARLSAEQLSDLLNNQLQLFDYKVDLSDIEVSEQAMQPLLAEMGNRLVLEGAVTVDPATSGLDLVLNPVTLLQGQVVASASVVEGVPVKADVTVSNMPVADLGLLFGQQLPLAGLLQTELTIAEADPVADTARSMTLNARLEQATYSDERLEALLGATPRLAVDWPDMNTGDLASITGLEATLTGDSASLRLRPKGFSSERQVSDVEIKLTNAGRIDPVLSGDLIIAGEVARTRQVIAVALAQPKDAGRFAIAGHPMRQTKLEASIDPEAERLAKLQLFTLLSGQSILLTGQDVSWGNALIDISRLQLDALGVTADVSGQAPLDERPLRLAVDVKAPSLDGIGQFAGNPDLEGRFSSNANITGTMAAPAIAMTIADGSVEMPGFVLADLRGKVNASAGADMTADAALRAMVNGALARVQLSVGMEGSQRYVLRTLEIDYDAFPVRLVAPATVALSANGQRVELQPSALTLSGHRLDIAGTYGPDRVLASIKARDWALQDFAEIANLPLAKGQADLDVSLNATRQGIDGSVSFDLSDLGATGQAGQALAPYRLQGTGRWDGRRLSIQAGGADANGAGPLDIDLAMPLVATASAAAPIAGVALPDNGDISGRFDGNLDLALLNQIVEAEGHRLAGMVEMALSLSGTIGNPVYGGEVVLRDASYQHLIHGAMLDNIHGRMTGSQSGLELTEFEASGTNGGTVTGQGRIGFGEETPISLDFDFNDAQIVQSDLLDLVLAGDIGIEGRLSDHLVAGDLTIVSAEIKLPKRLPASVARLDVVDETPRPEGEQPVEEEEASPIRTALDIAIKAPGRIYIRGLGLDVQVGGNLAVKGAAQSPDIEGSFGLVEGRLDVAGQTWTFDRGGLEFVGPDDTPVLDIAASRTAGDITAIISVEGPVSTPEIKLQSEPPLAQGEIASRILFGKSRGNLSAVQAVQATELLATLQGRSGRGVIGTAREQLGIDELSIDQTEGGGSVTAGKYISEGVFVGVNQGIGDVGSEVEVEVELTEILKFEGKTGTDNSSSVGLSVEWDY